MASKRTESTKAKKPAPKKAVKAAPKAPKGAAVKTSARHPRARVTDAHGGKEALAKALAATIARSDEDTDMLAAKLKTASNQQLLRLQKAAARVKEKWGSRAKLITAIGTAENKGKDKDYLAKLDSYSLGQLLDLATASERRART